MISKLKIEAVRLKGEVISISNSSDSYPNLEANTGLMRQCLEVLCQRNCKIQIITKSNIVTRDADLLKKIPSMVSLTITTLDEKIAELLEPNAPPPAERLKAAEILIAKGIPTSVRIDPVIPSVNDEPEELIKTLANIGVKHITSSTYKIKPDNWQRFTMIMSEVAKKLKPLYLEKGEKRSGYTFLPRELRLKLMKNVRQKTEENGMKFGVCREGLSQLNTASCDGSWLLSQLQR